MKLMKTSANGFNLIKKYEGLELKAYKCPAGVWTIGWGHTKGVSSGMVITMEKAEAFLSEDVTPVEKLLNGMKINFTQNQFDALVSWIFNLGQGNFNSSTLKKKILSNASDAEIVAEIKKWNKAGGKVLNGLVSRRNEEAMLWLK